MSCKLFNFQVFIVMRNNVSGNKISTHLRGRQFVANSSRQSWQVELLIHCLFNTTRRETSLCVPVVKVYNESQRKHLEQRVVTSHLMKSFTTHRGKYATLQDSQKNEKVEAKTRKNCKYRNMNKQKREEKERSYL